MFNMGSIMNAATDVVDKIMSSTMSLVDKLMSSVMPH